MIFRSRSENSGILGLGLIILHHFDVSNLPEHPPQTVPGESRDKREEHMKRIDNTSLVGKDDEH